MIANPRFGFQVSESGAGYTWAVNSRENQLTPWSNDPVSDPPGEVIYVRDEETRRALGADGAADPRGRRALRRPARPGLQPLRAHVARHRARARCSSCRSTIRSRSRGSTIENRSGRTRRLSVTAYVEWVLGASRGASAPFVVTEIDAETGALFARNPWNAEFGGPRRVRRSRRAPDRVDRRPDGVPRPQRHARPSRRRSSAAAALSGRVGAGLDPCARAADARSSCAPGERDRGRVLPRPGGDAAEDARALVARYRARRPRRRRSQAVTTHWDDILGAVQVQDARPLAWTSC